MKRTWLVLAIALLLAACSTAVGTETNGELLNEDYENAVPVEIQLLMGIFALEDSEFAITPDQANEMLPLWKAVRSLSTSETAAEEEIAAVYRQIEGALSPEQLDAIAAMALTIENFASIAENHGIDFRAGDGNFDPGNLSPEQQATFEALQESGGFQPPAGGGPGGGPGGGGFPGGGGGFPEGGPGGAGGPPGAEGFSPEAQQTAIAERGGVPRAGSGVNPAFLEAMITFLEGKIEG